MRKIILLVSIFISLPVLGDEAWECKDGSVSSSWNDIIVTAKTGDGKGFGSVNAANTNYVASYYTQGFKRRWDFGKLVNKSHPFSLIIKLNGDGMYFDFSASKTKGVTPASMFFKCRLKMGK